MSATGTRTKLRLTQGESTARSWELVFASAQTTLTVGAGADCNWVVHGDGVRARHFSLNWDGSQLRAADLGGVGGVTIDGDPLGTAWREVGERAQIQFGGAAISVEAIRLSEPEGHPLDAAGFGVLGGGVRAERASQRAVPAVGQVVTASAQPAAGGTPSSLARKATLVGVAPITAESPAGSRVSSVPPGDGFRVLRPSESAEKARRNSSAPPVPESQEAQVAQAAQAAEANEPIPLLQPAASAYEAPSASPEVVVMPAEPVAPAGPSPAKVAAMRSGTLIGVAVPDVLQSLRNKRAGGASFADEDQRTIHGYVPPSDVSAASRPAVVARSGTLIQVLDPRSQTSASDATQRIGSAWQESPTGDPAQFGQDSRPSGVLDSTPGFGTPRGAETWPMRDSAPSDRASDPNITAQYSSRAPSRGFPWRYLGIAMLTVVAYFAWLYLLDHL